MQTDRRRADDRPDPSTHTVRWVFVPVHEPDLDRSARHRDEPLRPGHAGGPRAQHLVRRTRRRADGSTAVDLYVRGVIVPPAGPPLALAGWHRAVAVPDGDEGRGRHG